MMRRSDDIRIEDFPNRQFVRDFQHTYPVGPSYIDSIREFMALRCDRIMQHDFDTGTTCEIPKIAANRIQGGDVMVLMSGGSGDWIFFYYSDLSWGILYSESDFGSILPRSPKELSDDFAEALNGYVEEGFGYDQDMMKEWGRAAKMIA